MPVFIIFPRVRRTKEMYQVLKRDGSVVDFEISKISAAMIKAFEALEKNYHPRGSAF